LAGIIAACSNDGSGGGQASSSRATTGATAETTGATDTTGATTTSGAATDSTIAAGAGAEIPDETAGPFPSDGSNGPNVLTDSGVVRADITQSIGDFSGTAEGVPMTLNLTVVDAATGNPLPGAAIYLWHCTAGGQYSIYEIDDQNYLRGVQAADDAGKVTFQTVFPGCYSGRWPHCHFEVFDDVASATSGNAAIKTSQLAIPQADCEAVYADDRYGNSLANLGRLSLQSDGIFADGWSDQLAVMTGSPDSSYSAALLVRV
jgi:protocatechuate 3,4-dioxygenase beta subunit